MIKWVFDSERKLFFAQKGYQIAPKILTFHEKIGAI